MTKPTKIAGLVVVADSAKARFLHFIKEDNRLAETATLMNASANMPERELTTDAPGRGFDHVSHARHALRNAHRKDHDAQVLAKDVAARINDASRMETVRKIVLVAAPRFLGQLRKYLSPASTLLLAAEVNKDLTHLSEDDILVEIADHLTGRWLS